MSELKRRLSPFLALLDTRYLPLLFAVLPQAYAVYLWLWLGSNGSAEAHFFAIAGGIGYEFIYVGAIAWAEEQRRTRWTQGTAVAALLFAVAIAVYVYRDQGAAAILHAGYPIVAFCYTMATHAPKRADPNEIEQLSTWLEQSKIDAEQFETLSEQQRARAEHAEHEFERVRAEKQSMADVIVRANHMTTELSNQLTQRSADCYAALERAELAEQALLSKSPLDLSRIAALLSRHEVPQREIAGVLGVSNGTVSNWISKAKAAEQAARNGHAVESGVSDG